MFYYPNKFGLKADTVNKVSSCSWSLPPGFLAYWVPTLQFQKTKISFFPREHYPRAYIFPVRINATEMGLSSLKPYTGKGIICILLFFKN